LVDDPGFAGLHATQKWEGREFLRSVMNPSCCLPGCTGSTIQAITNPAIATKNVQDPFSSLALSASLRERLDYYVSFTNPAPAQKFLLSLIHRISAFPNLLTPHCVIQALPVKKTFVSTRLNDLTLFQHIDDIRVHDRG